MYYLYFDVLEHDSEASKKLSKESLKYYPEICEKINALKGQLKDLRETLVKATKNSEKY